MAWTSIQHRYLRCQSLKWNVLVILLFDRDDQNISIKQGRPFTASTKLFFNFLNETTLTNNGLNLIRSAYRGLFISTLELETS